MEENSNTTTSGNGTTTKNVEESETVEEIPATIPKDISVFVSTDKRHTENEVITYKIKYYNLMDSPTGKFELFKGSFIHRSNRGRWSEWKKM